MNIDQIIDKYLELRSQGKSREEAYDFILLLGYPKVKVDEAFELIEFDFAMKKEILCMAESGLSPKQVVQILVDEGYSEALIRSLMEEFLEPEES